jgi:hypothetical protein
VRELPNIQAYLSSERRVPFGDGLYRKYSELDIEADLEDDGEAKKKKRKSSE